MSYIEKKEFLGRGWNINPEPDRITGRMKESSYEENIEQSIRIILQTEKGERVMRPDFGSRLRSYAFSEMNYTSMSQISREVKEALILWEPRIIDIDVHCEPSRDTEGCLLIHIGYTVRSTNNPYNMVFPFYLREKA